jgi:hypothetical protein
MIRYEVDMRDYLSISSGLAQLWQAKRIDVACVSYRGGVKDEKNRSDRKESTKEATVWIIEEMAFSSL